MSEDRLAAAMRNQAARDMLRWKLELGQAALDDQDERADPKRLVSRANRELGVGWRRRD